MPGTSVREHESPRTLPVSFAAAADVCFSLWIAPCLPGWALGQLFDEQKHSKVIILEDGVVQDCKTAIWGTDLCLLPEVGFLKGIFVHTQIWRLRRISSTSSKPPPREYLAPLFAFSVAQCG